MLSCLTMEIEGDNLDFKKSSNLQGVLFEHIRLEYAEKMHTQGLHPYSQYIIKRENALYWNICTLLEQAEREIIQPFLQEEIQSFVIDKGNIEVLIKKKELIRKEERQLMREFYEKEADRYFTISFLTPTSFKQKGKYVIWPDLRLIYQSLMNKYGAIVENTEMLDEDMLQMMAEQSEIIKYNLRTVGFPIEQIRIPSFIGKVAVRINGPETLANYIRMLLHFGEFSGVGVKTGMGMGAICINEGGRGR